MDADPEHIQLSQEPCPSHHYPASAVTKSSKDYSTFLSSQLLQDGGGHGKVSESYEHGSNVALLLCGVYSLTRSNAVWNTMMVTKASYKPMDSCFGRESKSIS